jgi:hypothetical protein
VRHRLAVILGLAVCAVLAGARSFTAIAEWAADADEQTLARLGVSGAVPSESTFRRTLQRLDADAFDDLAGQWAARRTVPGPGGRRVIAVDGKTLRGSGHGDQDSRHLLAAYHHAYGAVLGQVEVGAKTNEIPMFSTLLDRLDVADAVITADALHAQREHAAYLAGRGAHYLLIVEHGAHCSCLSAGCVKQSRLAVFYLDTQALPAALGDLDCVELAALDLVQHGLAGDPEDLGGCGECDPAGRGLGCDAVAELLVDADAPRRAGGELLSDQEAFPQPPVQGRGGHAELVSCLGDGDHERIVPAGCDIFGCGLVSGDVVVGAELADVGFGPGQPGGGAPALLPEDLGDGGIVVVPGEPAHQVQGVLAGDAAVLPGPGQRHGQFGTRAALPDDPQARGPFPRCRLPG